MQKPFIELKGISHTYAKGSSYAIKNLSCSLQPSQIIGILGPDGAGKTTLIRILTGILKPDLGKCFIDGNELNDDKKSPDDLIRYMPQKFGLYEDLTVIENLNLYADLNCLDSLTKKNEIEKLLHFTRLNSFQDRLAQDLSGGMKQKLGLACTLLKKPKLLVLDEPTVGVDPVSRKELWEIIHKLIEENITVVCSTSYLDEAEKFSTVIILKDGDCIYQGHPNFLKNNIINRTFFLKPEISNKREILTELILQPNILDGIIHGDYLRILSKKDHVSSCVDILEKIGSISPADPSFEDAYFDLLPESAKHRSPIYDLYPTFEKTPIPSVTAHSLTKKFGNFTAVNQISFEVRQGEIFGLLGPNGAGKSTTFKMLCGLIKTTSGESCIKNISLINSPSEARSKVGYMAQKFSLYSHMTVLQNLNFFYGIYPIYNRENHAVQEMVETFFLQPYLNTVAKDLPLGFKQRLALACAIMHRPEVLFLDEPTSGVDPITRREFWSHINALVAKNVAIIVTTHFMDEAEYCDRIGIVNQGNLIAIGTPEELKKKIQKENLPLPTMEQTFIELTKESSII